MKKSVFALLTATLAWPGFAVGHVFGEETITPTSATATATDTQLTVEQRLAILERKYENDREDAAAKSKDAATATAGKDGFSIKSADGNYVLRISGLVQADYRDYLNDHGAYAITDQFLLRRVRPTFEGTLAKYIAFRITPDFANGGGAGTTGTAAPANVLLPDAYLELQYINAARLRVGKFKAPVGFENLQSDPVMFFNERSLTNQLVPARDNGVQLSGEFRNGQLGYQAGVFNGQADGVTGEAESGDGKDYAGRIFVQPFKPASSEWINGFGLGFAGSIGDQFGSAATSSLTSGYKTDGQQTFFTYQSGTFANGERKRIDPHAYWYFSHVGFLGEFISSSQEVRRVTTSTATATLNNQAWVIEGSVVLTGERPSFNGIKPRHVFDPKSKTWGALEVVGRYSIFTPDYTAFQKGFASISSSSKHARSWSTGLNWYLNNNLRVNTNYAVTSFVGGAANGQDRPTEKVLLNRFQVTF